MNRSFFTDEQHAARWLARFAIPFANANTPRAIREAAFTAFAYNASMIWRGDGADVETSEADFENDEIYKHIKNNELVGLQELVKSMLYIVLSGKKHEELPSEIIQRITDIELEINKVVTRVPDCLVNWKGSGNSIIIPMPTDKESVLTRLKEWFILAITKCLYSFTILSMISPTRGHGFEKIGMCPVCGLFFEKIRKNKEFCSENCAETARMRRVRSKNK